MATNLDIDMNLLNEALHIGGFKTKNDTVNQALLEFIQRYKQREITAFLANCLRMMGMIIRRGGDEWHSG